MYSDCWFSRCSSARDSSPRNLTDRRTRSLLELHNARIRGVHCNFVASCQRISPARMYVRICYTHADVSLRTRETLKRTRTCKSVRLIYTIRRVRLLRKELCIELFLFLSLSRICIFLFFDIFAVDGAAKSSSKGNKGSRRVSN